MKSISSTHIPQMSEGPNHTSRQTQTREALCSRVTPFWWHKLARREGHQSKLQQSSHSTTNKKTPTQKKKKNSFFHFIHSSCHQNPTDHYAPLLSGSFPCTVHSSVTSRGTKGSVLTGSWWEWSGGGGGGQGNCLGLHVQREAHWKKTHSRKKREK